jgi:hypothetical protein
MRVLTPIVSLTIALLPAAAALPASPDSTPPPSPSHNITSRAPEPQVPSSGFFIGSNEEPSLREPVPEVNRWRDATTPAQIRGNCKGSAICSSVGDACKYAANRYDTSKVYRNYTSYTAQIGAAIHLDSCTAIFVCDDATGYGAGMTGSQIKAAYVLPVSISPVLSFVLMIRMHR